MLMCMTLLCVESMYFGNLIYVLLGTFCLCVVGRCPKTCVEPHVVMDVRRVTCISCA